MITPRMEELLSYLQGLGQVGTWVVPNHKHLAEDLGINNRPALARLANGLRHAGLIASRRTPGRVAHEYKVLWRLEWGVDVVRRKGGRPLGSVNGWRRTGHNRLLAYAGSEECRL